MFHYMAHDIYYTLEQGVRTEPAVPYSPEHKARTRARILTAARRRFKAEGFDGVGIDRLMADAGLTRGGFYAHFRSKSDLLAAVLAEPDPDVAADAHPGDSDLDPATALAAIVDGYLNMQHRADAAHGCPMTGLAADVRRADAAARAAYDGLVRYFAGMIEPLIAPPRGESAAARSLAIAALCVGALTLARAVDDDARAERILAAARRAALDLGGRSNAPKGKPT